MRIVAELEAMKQEATKKPESFASRFAFLLDELQQRCPPGEKYSGKRQLLFSLNQQTLDTLKTYIEASYTAA